MISDSGLWDDLTQESPLYSRAWVVQEFALASRILYFADGQLLWEYKEPQASETYSGGIPRRTAGKLNADPHCLFNLLQRDGDSNIQKYVLRDSTVRESTLVLSLASPQGTKLLRFQEWLGRWDSTTHLSPVFGAIGWCIRFYGLLAALEVRSNPAQASTKLQHGLGHQ